MNRRSAGTDFDCLIIGAGVIGLTMACLLIGRKLAARGRIAVIAERPGMASPTPAAEWDVRVFALSRASQRLLGLCGIWHGLPTQKMFAYERMCVWDASSEPRGRGSLLFDCAELGEPNLGTIVEGRALQAQCTQSANAAGVILIEAGLQGLAGDEAGVSVNLSDGRTLRANLLIAADGVDSITRKLLSIETAGHAYRQDALVAHVHTVETHANTAWQRFLGTGPLAFLPLPDGRSSIVWSTARAQAEQLQALDATAFSEALTTASGGVLGACRLTTPVTRFPLKLQYAMDYAKPHAVLLGDAAHVVHPLAGQGLNLGLMDCASLAQVLGDSDAGGAFGERKLLRRYERWRRSENLLAAAALDALERLFASNDPTLSRLRILGLSAVGKMPFIKRELAERALGISGDVPAFLK